MVQPSYELFGAVALLPLLAALMFAVYLLITRRYSAGEHPVTMQLWSAAGGIITIGACIALGELQNGADYRFTLPDLRAEGRTIVVDDVDGTAHRALGSLPNSVFVVGVDGRIQWRCTWNRPEVVADVLAADRSRPDLPWHREPGRIPPRLAARVMRLGGRNTFGHFFSQILNVVRQHVGAARLARRPGRTSVVSTAPCGENPPVEPSLRDR